MAHNMVYLDKKMCVYNRHDSRPLLSLFNFDAERIVGRLNAAGSYAQNGARH